MENQNRERDERERERVQDNKKKPYVEPALQKFGEVPEFTGSAPS